jgi:CRP-like cAMP-binding protein
VAGIIFLSLLVVFKNAIPPADGRRSIAHLAQKVAMDTPINLLLESLSNESKTALMSRCEHVELPLRTVLFGTEETPRYVHFMTSGIASTVTTMEGGEAVEVGLTGYEGFAEKTHVLGPQSGSVQCFMQVAGSALRMNYKQFRTEFFRNPEILQAVLRYVQQDSFVLAQLGACNRLHEVEARLARWLLMVHDRVGGKEIRLTQEFLGEMLGARRSSVNLAAGSLQRSGVIGYSRGKIYIDDRETLEAVACECYPIISKLFHGLYK